MSVGQLRGDADEKRVAQLRMGDTGTCSTNHQMSGEQLKAFLEAVKADAELQEKLKAASDADAVVAIAKEAGFMILADELKKPQAEVSEEELEGVAGGAIVTLVIRRKAWESCQALACSLNHC